MNIPTVQSRVARRLLEAAGREPAEHTVLEENVTHLLHQLKDDYVESLEVLPKEKLLWGLNKVYSNGPLHMGQKLSRDIRQKPYSDDEVVERLDELDAELKTTAEDIVKGSGGYPCKFYVAGSIGKGRFGARSDLDLLCQASPEWMKANRWTHAHSDVSVTYIDTDKPDEVEKVVGAFAPTREVSLEDIKKPDFLFEIYQQGLNKKGLALEDGHLVQTGDKVLRGVEVPPEDSKHVMWGLPIA